MMLSKEYFIVIMVFILCECKIFAAEIQGRLLKYVESSDLGEMLHVVNDVLIVIYRIVLILIIILLIMVFIDYMVLEISVQCKCIYMVSSTFISKM